MRKFVALGALAAMAAGTQAVAADGLSYTLVEGQRFKNDELEGFGVNGSYAFKSHFFALGGIETLAGDYNFKEHVRLSLGAGYHRTINKTLDVFATATLERVNNDQYKNFTGFSFGVGVRGRLIEKLEVNTGLEYMNITEGDTTLQLGGRWYFTKAFAAGLDLEDNDLGLTLRFAARYDFAPR